MTQESNKNDVQLKKKWKKIATFVFLVIIIGVVVMILQLKGPGVGVIKQGLSQTSSSNTQTIVEKIRYEGRYLSFAYLSSYAPVKDRKANIDAAKTENQSSFLESVFLTSYSAVSSKKLAVSVEGLPSGNLEDNSSFKFRTVSPKLYTQSMVDINGGKAILFTRDGDVREQGVFLQHNDLSVAVVISSSSVSLDTMREELIAVVKSIAWK